MTRPHADFARLKSRLPTAAATANRLRDDQQERELLLTIINRIAEAEPGQLFVAVHAMSTTVKSVLRAKGYAVTEPSPGIWNVAWATQ